WVAIELPIPDVPIGEVPLGGPGPQGVAPIASPSYQAPLFSAEGRRRAAMKFVASLDAGGDFLGGATPNGALTAALRFTDMFEVGGGLRQIFAAPALARVSTPQAAVFGFGRLGLHLELDAAHTVAVPVSVDFGGGFAAAFLKINAGLRLR